MEEAEMLKKVVWHSVAIALANIVCMTGKTRTSKVISASKHKHQHKHKYKRKHRAKQTHLASARRAIEKETLPWTQNPLKELGITNGINDSLFHKFARLVQTNDV